MDYGYAAVVALAVLVGGVAGVYISKKAGEFTRTWTNIPSSIVQAVQEVASAAKAIHSAQARHAEATSSFVSATNSLEREIQGLSKANDELLSLVREVHAALKRSAEVASKLAEVSAVQADALKAVSKLEQDRLKHPFGKSTSSSSYGQITDAETEYRIQQMMKEHGYSRDHALMVLNQASSFSVWDGFDVEGKT